jgi:hypothetical protein
VSELCSDCEEVVILVAAQVAAQLAIEPGSCLMSVASGAPAPDVHSGNRQPCSMPGATEPIRVMSAQFIIPAASQAREAPDGRTFP